MRASLHTANSRRRTGGLAGVACEIGEESDKGVGKGYGCCGEGEAGRDEESCAEFGIEELRSRGRLLMFGFGVIKAKEDTLILVLFDFPY